MSKPLHLSGAVAFVAVGPAASGKSTVLRELVGRGVIDEVVSTDAIRAELGLAPAETATAYAIADERLRAGLEAGRVVAVDSTNVTREARDRVADVVGAHPRVALRVGGGLTLADLVFRDAGRDRHVPAEAIAEKHRQFVTESREVDLRAEGFLDVLTPEATGRAVRCPACACADVLRTDPLPAPVGV